MAWTTLSATDVKTRLAGAEVTALQTVALASGQPDPLPEIVEQVIDEVRGYIAAGGFRLGNGTTVPSKLVSATLAVIRMRLATRLPRFPFDDNRRLEYSDAIRLLNRVADGKYAIEDPEEVTDETIGTPSPSFGEPDLDWDADDQDGL